MKLIRKSTVFLILFGLFHEPSVYALRTVVPPISAPLRVEAEAIVELASEPVTKLKAQSIGHPRITGEYLPEIPLKDALGESITLGSLTRHKFTVLVFSKPENIRAEVSSGYFRKILPYLREVGYQIIVVTTESNDTIRDVSQRIKQNNQGGGIFIDESRSVLIKMGLTSDAKKDAPMINAIYLVSPDEQILFHYASVSDKIPFSGEVLVLAARVYKDAFTKDEK